MIKKINSVLLILFLVAGSSFANVTVIWNTASGALALGSDSTTPLPNSGSSATAGFCQLLYIGTAYDGLGSSGTGVLGDDVVLQTSFIGTGAMSAAGTLSGSYNNTTYAIGSQFLIRFFDTPSPTYGVSPAGLVPTTGHYGISQIYTTTQLPSGAPVSETFSFDTNHSATIAVVPEPSTVALMLAGLGVLGFRRIRRK